MSNCHIPSRAIFLNQMAGPLFRQLAEGLIPSYPDGVILITGHPDTLECAEALPKGISIIKAPTYIRKSNFTRILSWLKYCTFVIPCVLFAKPTDVFVVSSNPPILSILIFILAFPRRIPYANLVYDIFPDVLTGEVNSQTLNPLLWCWRFLNMLAYNNSKSVITISPRMAKRLSLQTRSTISSVYPWVDSTKIFPVDRCSNPYLDNFIQPHEFIILYSGNMGLSHDIKSILESARQLRHYKDIKFIFIGDGENRSLVSNYIASFPHSNVALYPYQDEALLTFTLSLADISVVSLDEGMEDILLPSKFFYYLAAGSAILGISRTPSTLTDLFQLDEIGAVVPPRRPDLISSEILRLYSSPLSLRKLKKNSRYLAQEHFSMPHSISKMTKIFQSCGIAV